MKRSTIYISTALVAAMMFGGQLVSNPTGAPSPATGGPKEGGATCAQGGCHFGTASAATGIITSNIPVAGYTPGASYDITVTSSGSGEKGFMVSAQDASGNLMGNMTAGTGSKKVNTNYITHTSAKTDATAVWTFKWTAPAAGSGAVTIYGAFAVTRNTTKKEQVTIQENTLATALLEVEAGKTLVITPNPAVDQTLLTYRMQEQGQVTIRLVSLDGKISETLFSGMQAAGEQSQQLNVGKFPSGIYLMQVETSQGNAYQKVMITR